MRNGRAIITAIWLLAGGAVLHATTVVSASCDMRVDGPDGTVEHLSQSGSSCALVSPMFGGGPFVDTSVSSSLTSSLMKIDVSSLIGAYPANVPFGSGLYASSSATVDITVDYLLATPGAARSGFVQLSVPGYSIGGFNPGADAPQVMFSTVQIGNLSITCDRDSCNDAPFLGGTTAPFPLGETFEFRSEMQMQGAGSLYSGEGFLGESGFGSLNFGFSMLDTDQSTPVALVQVPEASTSALLLLAAPMLYRLRRSRNRPPHRVGDSN